MPSNFLPSAKTFLRPKNWPNWKNKSVWTKKSRRNCVENKKIWHGSSKRWLRNFSWNLPIKLTIMFVDSLFVKIIRTNFPPHRTQRICLKKVVTWLNICSTSFRQLVWLVVECLRLAHWPTTYAGQLQIWGFEVWSFD